MEFNSPIKINLAEDLRQYFLKMLKDGGFRFNKSCRSKTSFDNTSIYVSGQLNPSNGQSLCRMNWLDASLLTRLPNSAFFKRTAELLYVKVTDTGLYLVDVLDHDPIEGFANRRLFEIIHNNWPEIIRRYRMGGIIVGDDLKNEEIDVLRRNSFCSFHDSMIFNFILP